MLRSTLTSTIKWNFLLYVLIILPGNFSNSCYQNVNILSVFTSVIAVYYIKILTPYDYEQAIYSFRWMCSHLFKIMSGKCQRESYRAVHHHQTYHECWHDANAYKQVPIDGLNEGSLP